MASGETEREESFEAILIVQDPPTLNRTVQMVAFGASFAISLFFFIHNIIERQINAKDPN